MRWTTLLAVSLLIVSALLVVPADAPVRISYVVSDSMEPTLHQGDGYLVVPADDVEPGDIVVYYSEIRDTYVTHRVVRESPRGFITKGDANPTPDQLSGYPPIERDQIVGQVFTVKGSVVVLPGLGPAIDGLRRYRVTAYVGLLALFGAAVLRERLDHRPDRQLWRVSDLVVPVLVALALVGILVPFLGATHTAIAYTVTETGTAKTTIPAKSPVTRTHEITVIKTPLSYSLVGVDRGTVVDRTRRSLGGSGLFHRVRVTLRVRYDLPTDLQRFSTGVTVQPYPKMLPRSTIEELHSWSPIVAAICATSVLVIPTFALFRLTMYFDRVLRAPRMRWLRRFLEQ